MVGGVLVERTVKEVVPALVNNRDKMEKLIETLNSQAERERRPEMESFCCIPKPHSFDPDVDPA
jgi:hypothetical protein